MPLWRCFDFSGRSRRLEYWMFVLFVVLASLAILVAARTMVGVYGADPPIGDSPSRAGTLTAYVLLLFWLAMLLPWLSVLIRRLHDSDRSGLWVLIWFAPFGAVVLFVFAVLEGTQGSNSYGEDPKQEPYVADVFG